MKKNFYAKTSSYKFQSQAVSFLKNLDYGGIFFEQGLGKTKIAIDLILYWLNNKKLDLIIVVTKKGLIKTWEDEISLHSSISYEIIKQNKKVSSSLLLSGINLLITNYEVIGNQYKKFFPLSKLKKIGIILDESAKIKNPNSELTKKFFSLIDLFKKRFILTGTPSANRPYDLWAQIKFLDKGVSLKVPYEVFLKKLDIKNSLSKSIKEQEEFLDSLEQIFDKVSNFCIRETKRNNLKNLTEKKFITIRCGWEEKQKKLYDKLRLELRAYVKKMI